MNNKTTYAYINNNILNKETLCATISLKNTF